MSRPLSSSPGSTKRTKAAYAGARFDSNGYCLTHQSMQLCKPISDNRYEIIHKTCPKCHSSGVVPGSGRRQRRPAAGSITTPRKVPPDLPEQEQGVTLQALPRWWRALGNGSTKSSTVLDFAREIRIDPSETSEGIDAPDDGVATQTTGPSTRVEAADGNPHRASPEAMDRDKMKREGSMTDLFLVLQEERPPTVLFQCSTTAVKEGLRNSNFVSSQVLEEFTWGGGGEEEEEDNTPRNEDEDRGAAATKRQDARCREPRPAQLKNPPGQVESGMDGAAPGRGPASCKRVEGGTGRVPLYLKGAEVGYRSASLPLQAATVVDVHQDNMLEPYYTIRMREGGREKQTDNAHLVPGPWREHERMLQS